jgi:hypothetical protein
MGYEHWMHAQVFELDRDAMIHLDYRSRDENASSTLSTNLGTFGKQSWIVLDGEVKFETHADEAGKKETEFLSPDSSPVLHLRNEAQGRLIAYSPCKLLRIEHSAEGCYDGLRHI